MRLLSWVWMTQLTMRLKLPCISGALCWRPLLAQLVFILTKGFAPHICNVLTPSNVTFAELVCVLSFWTWRQKCFYSQCCVSFLLLITLLQQTTSVRWLLHACKVLFSALSVTFLFVFFVCYSNISRTAELICTKFTGKTCLVHCSDEFECRGQTSRSSGTKTLNSAITPLASTE